MGELTSLSFISQVFIPSCGFNSVTDTACLYPARLVSLSIITFLAELSTLLCPFSWHTDKLVIFSYKSVEDY